MSDGPATTDDLFFDGRLRLLQPAIGYRAAVDPLLLAAAVDARPGARLADIGCGIGTAAFCVAQRLTSVTIDGLEVQADLADLARRNAERNGLADRFTVSVGDVGSAPELPGGNDYDHVLTNPPYGDPARDRISPDAAKAVAHTGIGVDLETWVGYCLSILKPKGSLTIIHRASALDRLLAVCAGQMGEITVFPLWPKQGRAAKRIIIRGRKGIATPLRICPGLILHREDGTYSDRAEKLLRTPLALDLMG